MERLSLLYASALFDLALESDSVDEFLSQSALIRDTLQDSQCQRILVHPHISAAEKQEFFRKAFAAHIHADLLGFLFLVTEKNREAFMLSALTALIDMINSYKGKVTANVYFASALNGKQIAEIKKTLSKKLNKNVEIKLTIDTTVIGGPYIFADGYYLDWTVKKRLRDLMVHMKEGCSA